MDITRASAPGWSQRIPLGGHLVSRAFAILLATAAASQALQVTTEIHEMFPPGAPGSPVLTPGTLPINYHVLHNGMDAVYLGVGAGGGQTDMDGIGTWIPGEDLRGALVRASDNACPYRMTAWRETVCLSPGDSTIDLPLIVWAESTGGPNLAHTPQVFPKPTDPTCAIFPLNGGSSFVPFGGPGGIDFVPATVPGGAGDIFLPNEGLAYNMLLMLTNLSLPVPTSGDCWVVQLELINDPVESIDPTPNGWWHWARNSQTADQSWGFSIDELNLWKSHTAASDNDLQSVLAFNNNVEYAMQMATADPSTNLATAPTGFTASGSYYLNTANYVDGISGSPTLNINGGHDMGGHGTLSLSGVAGVPNANTGLGAQDPAGVGGIAPSGTALLPSLGFWTFDAGPTGAGTKRLTWVRLDLDNLNGVDPALGSVPTVSNNTVCVPISVDFSGPPGPFLQTTTATLWGLFSHETAPCLACPDPDGLGAGSFGVSTAQGGSIQLPLPVMPVCASVGLGGVLPLEYGTSGLKGPTGGGAPMTGGLTWLPALASPSGTRVMYVLD